MLKPGLIGLKSLKVHSNCYDPGDEPEPGSDPTPDPEDMASGIRECARRFVASYMEAYQCPPPHIYTRLAQKSYADGVAQ